jgi:hypothetical protein
MDSFKGGGAFDEGVDGVVGEIGDLIEGEGKRVSLEEKKTRRGKVDATNPDETDSTKLWELRELKDAHVGELRAA